MNALDGLARGLGSLQVKDDVDPPDHEDPVLLLDLAADVGREVPVARVDLTRLQRASKRARQSPARGGDDVVERRRVRRRAPGLHAVVLSHGPVHAEVDRLRL